MVALLPTHQAADLVSGIQDYLTTTFALSDKHAQAAIREFLTDRDNGMFKGPYVRLRLPFEPAPKGWEDALEHHIGEFTPYGHQAKAYKRLSSLGTGTERFRRPQPTLVTTGTGSGKTEAFLHPILDHVLRAQQAGIKGMKALLLYPMNALANDQASRLASLITQDPRLAGVRAAIYTGQKVNTRSKVTADGLINDRGAIRDHVPDILLTNYKMLDQLLLRHEDAKLWSESATSLQYLVLDEFHTYDGAQGTDVAMLLRRLGVTLKSYWPAEDSTRAVHITAEDRQRPLGLITPVATSATLGGGDGGQEMLEFAHTIFGETFDEDALITESRMPFDTWRDQSPAGVAQPRDMAALMEQIEPTNDAIAENPAADSAFDTILHALFETAVSPEPETLLDALRHHPLTERLVELTTQAQDITELARKLFPSLTRTQEIQDTAEFLAHVFALYSYVRVECGRSALTVETHLWVRELSRIDAEVDTALHFRWGDDPVEEADENVETEAPPTYLPAIYCRHCGRYGWGAKLASNQFEIVTNPAEIRQAAATDDSQFRAMLDAAPEADEAASTQRDYRQTKEIGLRYFHRQRLDLSVRPPDDDDPDLHRGLIIPVLCLDGDEAGEQSRKDVCPACFAEDAIRFVGSAISTLTSVAISTLFGDAELDNAEKKALVFTDSVQDAAHRAGFIQARSRTFTLRTQLRSGFKGAEDQVLTLSQLVDNVMRVPDDSDEAFYRYRLVPPDLVERNGFAAFWQDSANPRDRSRAASNVRRRLLFDASLELGLNARLGRTLELTGSVVAEADAGSEHRMLTAAKEAWDTSLHVLPDIGVPTKERYLHWVRGVLIRMRLQGGILHDWLRRYIENEGRRYWIWGGRPRDQGMPAFPYDRSAPAFPVVGSVVSESGLDPVGNRTNWYTDWTHRTLGVNRDDGQVLIRRLLESLADRGIVTSVPVKNGATAYALDPEQILLAVPTDEGLKNGNYAVECSVCGTYSFGTPTVVEQMLGAPCLRPTCQGEQQAGVFEAENYYRRLYASTDGKRVVAREHTSLLSDKDRLNFERGFKRSHQDPDDPNVLVATPTLEMGIDIGDLSCVMLASLPTSVASYVQRIGRAGRLTGNALAIAFVRGRGEHLPKLNDPLSIINGEVRPPRTYLEAEEILVRQYLAFLGDKLARDPQAVHPTSTSTVMSSAEPHTYLGQLIALARDGGEALVDEFFAAFGELVSEAGRAGLHDWVANELELVLEKVTVEWRGDREALIHRIEDADRAIVELTETYEQVKHDYGHDADHANVKDAERDLKSATAQRSRLNRELTNLTKDWWISVLERYGIFPNYTLIGEPVVLDVGVSWRDEETQEFDAETRSLERAADVAVQELAPGAKFYAYGMEIDIDAVDMGPNLRDLQYWQICQSCGWIHSVMRAGTGKGFSGLATVCARCGQGEINDQGQVFTALELKRVSAEVRRDEAAISDNRDDRRRTRFTTVSVADVEPDGIDRRWFVQQNGFGVEYLQRTTVTHLNFGKASWRSPERHIAGYKLKNAPLFTVCSYCGQLDQTPRNGSRTDSHRFWCRHRKAEDPPQEELLLAHRLQTQGVKLHLPAEAAFLDDYVAPSLLAALQLGLAEHLGGTTGQVRAFSLPTPEGEHGTTLLIHDTVPGGTGYLAAFREPSNVFALLHVAWDVVRKCPCAGENRRACHLCLLPYAPHQAEDHVSRVVAERLLAQLLNADPAVDRAEFDDWTIQDEPIEAHSDESVLEVQFREALKRRLDAANIRWETIPTARGEEVVFRLKHQHFEWRLRPQQDMVGSRPDFTLSPSDQNIPSLAVFTDGFTYHATSRHNRVGDDAMKRDALRQSSEAIPWAITYQDVADFDRPEEDHETGARAIHPWIDTTVLENFQQVYSFETKILRALEHGNMELLWAWIQHPVLQDWQQFANAAPGLTFAGNVTYGAVEQDVADAVRLTAQQTNKHLKLDDAPNAMFWGRNMPHLTMLSAGELAKPTAELRSVLVLNDDTTAVTAPDYQASWQQWLRWSNLLGFATNPRTHLIATSGVIQQLWEEHYGADELVSSAAGHPAVDVAQPPVPVGWQEIFDETGEDEHDFLRTLIEHDLPAPEIGDEVDGIMLQLAWPDQRVAVVYDPEDVEPVAAQGWTVVVTEDPAAVVQALR
jgi:ATP-dependent helicase YprA (DUF1998 family)